ncbi:hypothetical protein CGC20_21735 [Leishmania donovani]|uniref:Uncharacterized protein n=1 Tax=Leishmania donovani TaxID=5661 RepID=A0A504XGH2_LEIDO|nr:hypothetical protein CGC20_21735 [Leishmania donovani]
MSAGSKNFYASMVLKSNYPDAPAADGDGGAPKKGPQPYRSPCYNSAQTHRRLYADAAFFAATSLQSPQMLQAHVPRPTVLIPMAGHETIESSKQSGKIYTHNPTPLPAHPVRVPLAEHHMESSSFTSPYITAMHLAPLP